MKNLHKIIYITVGTLALSCLNHANAQTIITQWNFDKNASGVGTPTGTNLSPAPSTGIGTASSLGMTNSYTSSLGNGSVDGSNIVVSTTAPDNVTGSDQVWRVVGGGAGAPGNGWNSAAGIGTQGAQFSDSTVGFSNVTLSFDIDITAQGEANLYVQYTTNGTTWITTPLADYTSEGITATHDGIFNLENNTTSSNTVAGAYLSGVGKAVGNTDTFFQGVTLSFAGITAANNDPNFGVRIVNASTGGDDYALKENGTVGNYTPATLNNTTGNWRFDNVSIDGTAIATPEPSTYALMLGGLAMLFAIHRLRRSTASNS